MDKKFIKIITVAAVFILILNMILLATKKINELSFWIIIIAAAVFVYVVLPKMRNGNK
ncbi:hypothetical protein HYX06_03245 [Candidatus Woesearchaeota archaeon]|nr:hypothetical protein [Candidatus Woesearchaeota archaeon]